MFCYDKLVITVLGLFNNFAKANASITRTDRQMRIEDISILCREDGVQISRSVCL